MGPSSEHTGAPSLLTRVVFLLICLFCCLDSGVACMGIVKTPDGHFYQLNRSYYAPLLVGTDTNMSGIATILMTIW